MNAEEEATGPLNAQTIVAVAVKELLMSQTEKRLLIGISLEVRQEEDHSMAQGVAIRTIPPDPQDINGTEANHGIDFNMIEADLEDAILPVIEITNSTRAAASRGIATNLATITDGVTNPAGLTMANHPTLEKTKPYV